MFFFQLPIRIQLITLQVWICFVTLYKTHSGYVLHFGPRTEQIFRFGFVINFMPIPSVAALTFVSTMSTFDKANEVHNLDAKLYYIFERPQNFKSLLLV